MKLLFMIKFMFMVPFLSSSVPNLSFDALAVDGDGSCLELDSDGGLGVEAEIVPGEPPQHLRLPHRRVPHHHYLEHVVDVRHHLHLLLLGRRRHRRRCCCRPRLQEQQEKGETKERGM